MWDAWVQNARYSANAGPLIIQPEGGGVHAVKQAHASDDPFNPCRRVSVRFCTWCAAARRTLPSERPKLSQQTLAGMARHQAVARDVCTIACSIRNSGTGLFSAILFRDHARNLGGPGESVGRRGCTVTRGKRVDGSGAWMRPTILTDITPGTNAGA